MHDNCSGRGPNSDKKQTSRIRDAIFARPAGTRPGPTLMGRILPSPIRNRVGYGFKKKPEADPGRVWVLSKKSETRPGYNPIKITKKAPIYI